MRVHSHLCLRPHRMSSSVVRMDHWQIPKGIKSPGLGLYSIYTDGPNIREAIINTTWSSLGLGLPDVSWPLAVGDSQRSVLLLEAGPDYPDPTHLPDELKYDCHQAASQAGAPHTGRSSVRHLAAVQAIRCPGESGRRHQCHQSSDLFCVAPGGLRRLGGSGNDEWSYRNVLPYFKKSERDLDIQDEFHGTDGPIPVRRHHREYWVPFQAAFYHACSDMDTRRCGLEPPHVWWRRGLPAEQPDGIRMSTALTYLQRLSSPPESKRQSQRAGPAHSLRGQQAVGVEVDNGGEIFGRRSGRHHPQWPGPFNPRKILMLSVWDGRPSVPPGHPGGP